MSPCLDYVCYAWHSSFTHKSLLCPKATLGRDLGAWVWSLSSYKLTKWPWAGPLPSLGLFPFLYNGRLRERLDHRFLTSDPWPGFRDTNTYEQVCIFFLLDIGSITSIRSFRGAMTQRNPRTYGADSCVIMWTGNTDDKMMDSGSKFFFLGHHTPPLILSMFTVMEERAWSPHYG